MTFDNFYILLEISILCAFLPIIVFFFYVKSINQTSDLVLFFLAALWLTFEILNYIFALCGRNTNLNIHIYDLISTLLYLIYFKHIFKSDTINKILNVTGILYTVVTIVMIVINSAYFDTVLTNLALTMTIPFVLALLSFYKIAKDANVNNLLNNPSYWINSAILIHFGMSLTVVLISDIMYDNLNLHLYIWPVVIISNIFYNILFTIGAWQMRRT